MTNWTSFPWGLLESSPIWCKWERNKGWSLPNSALMPSLKTCLGDATLLSPESPIRFWQDFSVLKVNHSIFQCMWLLLRKRKPDKNDSLIWSRNKYIQISAFLMFLNDFCFIFARFLLLGETIRRMVLVGCQQKHYLFFYIFRHFILHLFSFILLFFFFLYFSDSLL